MGPPAFRGVPAGAGSGFDGLTCAFARLLSFRSSLSVGKRALPVMPDTIEGRYCKLLMWRSESFGESGLGPFGLAPVPRPLAAIQTRSWRFGVAAAKTG